MYRSRFHDTFFGGIMTTPFKSPLLNQIWNKLKTGSNESHIFEFSLFTLLDNRDMFSGGEEFRNDIGEVLHLSGPFQK